MIACKEDLKGFYVLRSDEEVFELFMDKCEEFGVEWNAGGALRGITGGEAISLSSTCGRLGFSSERFYIDSGIKRLTALNFKQTRTEYVKVTDSIFDLYDDLNHGNLFWWYESDCNDPSDWVKVNSEYDLSTYFAEGNLYRKVEREITWQDELMDAIKGGNSIGEGSVRVGGSDLTDEQFIEMCHKVYHLTK